MFLMQAKLSGLNFHSKEIASHLVYIHACQKIIKQLIFSELKISLETISSQLRHIPFSGWQKQGENTHERVKTNEGIHPTIRIAEAWQSFHA